MNRRLRDHSLEPSFPKSGKHAGQVGGLLLEAVFESTGTAMWTVVLVVGHCDEERSIGGSGDEPNYAAGIKRRLYVAVDVELGQFMFSRDCAVFRCSDYLICLL